MLVRRLLDGETVTHDGPVYRMHDALCAPRPVQVRLPIMIGGSGPKKTLRTLARYGDQWNSMGDGRQAPGERDAILREHCDDDRPRRGRDRAHDDRRHRDPRHATRTALAYYQARLEANGEEFDPDWNFFVGPPGRDRRGPGADPRAGLPARAHRHARAVRHGDDRADRRAGRAAQRVTAPSVVALAGGVGGREARRGARTRTSAIGLSVVVNTGDDCERHGLLVMPDHDTVLYNLAGHRAGRVGLGHRGRHARDDGAARPPTARRTGSRSATGTSRCTSPGRRGCGRAPA